MRLKLLILLLSLQSAWIIGTAFVQERALVQGKVILLETRRVDPRDLLRGDYLILNYKISDVPKNVFFPPLTMDIPVGTKVFVALAATNTFFEVVKASTGPFVPGANETLLRGRCDPRWWSTNTVHVEYGIEEYYVAEGKGNPTGKLTAQAVVASSGQAHLKQVFVNGKPYAEAMKGGGD